MLSEAVLYGHGCHDDLAVALVDHQKLKGTRFERVEVRQSLHHHLRVESDEQTDPFIVTEAIHIHGMPTDRCTLQNR